MFGPGGRQQQAGDEFPVAGAADLLKAIREAFLFLSTSMFVTFCIRGGVMTFPDLCFFQGRGSGPFSAGSGFRLQHIRIYQTGSGSYWHSPRINSNI